VRRIELFAGNGGPKARLVLATATNAPVPVEINFGGCAPAAKFTVSLAFSANGGAASGTRSFALQQP